MICAYCRRELDHDSPDTYHAIYGWETTDQATDLRWITRDVFACRPCVVEHFAVDVFGVLDEPGETPATG